MTGKIYHICEDEKFINSAIHQFETVFPEQNEFYVVVNDALKEFKHIKDFSFVHRCNARTILAVIDKIENQDIVVFHSLSPVFYDFVLKLPRLIKTVWFCFGFEVYNNYNFFKEEKLLAPITRLKFSEPKPKKKFKRKIKDFLKPYLRFFRPKTPYTKEEKVKKSFARIDYLGSSFEEEFTFITILIRMKKKFFSFWYYPLEQIVDVNSGIEFNKRNILIGNSGFKTGNHLDVFSKIKNYDLGKNKIVIPLNYGKQEYILDIKEKAENQFGTNLEVLTEFMPLVEYNKILNQTGVAILYNKRQQALGNTIALLWFGAKVFLSDQNPFYSFLKRSGIHVYSVENDLNERSCKVFLNLEQIQHNRKVLFDLLNESHLLSNLKQQLKDLNE